MQTGQRAPASLKLVAVGGAAVGAQAARARRGRSASRPTRAMACPKAPRCRRSTCPAPTAPAAPAGRCRMRASARGRGRRDRSRAAACSAAISAMPTPVPALVAHRRPRHDRRRRLRACQRPQEERADHRLRPQRLARMGGDRAARPARGRCRPWCSATASRRSARCCGRCRRDRRRRAAGGRGCRQRRACPTTRASAAGPAAAPPSIPPPAWPRPTAGRSAPPSPQLHADALELRTASDSLNTHRHELSCPTCSSRPTTPARACWPRPSSRAACAARSRCRATSPSCARPTTTCATRCRCCSACKAALPGRDCLAARPARRVHRGGSRPRRVDPRRHRGLRRRRRGRPARHAGPRDRGDGGLCLRHDRAAQPARLLRHGACAGRHQRVAGPAGGRRRSRSRWRLPDAAFSYLRSHGTLDQRAHRALRAADGPDRGPAATRPPSSTRRAPSSGSTATCSAACRCRSRAGADRHAGVAQA